MSEGSWETSAQRGKAKIAADSAESPARTEKSESGGPKKKTRIESNDEVMMTINEGRVLNGHMPIGKGEKSEVGSLVDQLFTKGLMPSQINDTPCTQAS